MTDQPRVWVRCPDCGGDKDGKVSGYDRINRIATYEPCPTCALHFADLDHAVKTALLDKWPLCKHYDCLRVDEAVKAEREAILEILKDKREFAMHQRDRVDMISDEVWLGYWNGLAQETLTTENLFRARANKENGRTR